MGTSNLNDDNTSERNQDYFQRSLQSCQVPDIGEFLQEYELDPRSDVAL